MLFDPNRIARLAGGPVTPTKLAFVDSIGILHLFLGPAMAWFIRKPRKRTYDCIGWTDRYPGADVFREVALPGVRVMRVMDRAVHQAALEHVGEKLVELKRRGSMGVA